MLFILPSFLVQVFHTFPMIATVSFIVLISFSFITIERARERERERESVVRL